MQFQKTLLTTVALAMLALPACAQTYKQTQGTELAGGKHLKSVKIIELKGDGSSVHDMQTGIIELEGTAMAFLDGDGFDDMDVEVTRGENGEKIIVMNGEKITLKDGTHQWKSKDGKTIKFVMDKHNKKHSKHIKKMKMRFADAAHSDASIKELFARVGGTDGMTKTKIMFVGSIDGELGEGKYPRMISLDGGTQVFIEKNGDVKVMKDGKKIDTSQYGANQMSVNKSITNENGKRKTRIVIELEDDQ